FGRKKPAEAPAAVELSPADEADSDETGPFYKREISFRRPSDSPQDELAPVEDDHVEAIPAADPVEETHEEARVHDAQAADPVVETQEETQEEAHEEAQEEVEAPAPEPVAAAPAPRVMAPEPAPAPVASVEPMPEPRVVPEEAYAPSGKVPLHKRELSLGRKSAKPSSDARSRGGSRRSGRKLVGLKIGASQLAAAVVQESDGRHELLELARTPLEPGIVLDGEVRDADALVAALRSFFAEQKLPTRDVRIGVASNRIGVRTFEIAGIADESRFDNAIP